MGKRKRQISGVRFTNEEMNSKKTKELVHIDNTIFAFDNCCLTYLPMSEPLVDKYGYVYSKEGAEEYAKTHNTHPFINDVPFSMDDLVPLNFATQPNGIKYDQLTGKDLNPNDKIVAVRTSGNVYTYESLYYFNLKPKVYIDTISQTPFTPEDVVTIHDPKNIRKLPQSPLVVLRTVKKLSETVKNARAFIESHNFQQGQDVTKETGWYLARPTPESLKLATEFKSKRSFFRNKPHVVLQTVLGPIIIELDVGESTLGSINFLGYIFKGAYNHTKVKKVVANDYFLIHPNIEVDETVWGTPIAYETDYHRRNFRYPVWLINTGNVQIHLTNTGILAIGCHSFTVDDHHIIGGVVSGENIVMSLCQGEIFPDGRPVKPFSIETVDVVDNPFPVSE